MTNIEEPKKGFAKMTPEQRSAISRIGGQAAHAMGVAHRFTSDEARVAGQKGGRKVSADRERMSEMGKRGAAERERRRAERSVFDKLNKWPDLPGGDGEAA